MACIDDETAWMTYAAAIVAANCPQMRRPEQISDFADAMLTEHRKRFPVETALDARHAAILRRVFSDLRYGRGTDMEDAIALKAIADTIDPDGAS
jgi:hypothetical protein